jgi:hypothetical protein
MKMKNKQYKFKSKQQEELFNELLKSEKDCSFNGRKVLISGNLENLDERDLALSYPITPDQFMWLKLEAKVFDLGLDHRNSYKQLKDKQGNSWYPRPDCHIYNSEGKKCHPFLKTILKRYPGENNWAY